MKGRHNTILAAALLATFVSAATLASAATPEEKCLKDRSTAAGKYVACHQKALGKHASTPEGVGTVFWFALSKCREKYAATWTKLQAHAAGTGATCDRARLEDNGDGTVTDWLTGLQWEKKTNADNSANFSDPHDADNEYKWTVTGVAADGPAFTSFLATLNSPSCFAGQCDWRLPSADEFASIMQPYPCTQPCMDPIFGTALDTSFPWTRTNWTVDPGWAWIGGIRDGSMVPVGKTLFDPFGLFARAVRGGL
jgi:hypothetical protein